MLIIFLYIYYIFCNIYLLNIIKNIINKSLIFNNIFYKLYKKIIFNYKFI